MVCAIGLGSVAGLSRVFDRAAISRRSGCHLLLLAVLAAIALADLSMLSKAETERIWLPFTIWLTAAPALLPPRSHRLWAGGQRPPGPLLLNSIIFTNW
ncbi:conserved integral membrane protein [Mycobacterium tuberculosis EAS054]|nr:conserved integral membrane protein [Mycobacterium tuberculosis EAS054]